MIHFHGVVYIDNLLIIITISDINVLQTAHLPFHCVTIQRLNITRCLTLTQALVAEVRTNDLTTEGYGLFHISG